MLSKVLMNDFRITSKSNMKYYLHRSRILSNVQLVRYTTTEPSNKDLDNKKDRIFTIPNAMSAVRLVSAPVISYFMIKNYTYLALGTFIVSSLLDFADGFVARYFHQESSLGSMLDPLADKTLAITIALTQTYTGMLPWQLMTLIIGRDVGLLTGFLYLTFKNSNQSKLKISNILKLKNLAGKIQIKPFFISKLNTVLLFILFAFGMTHAAFALPPQQIMSLMQYSVGFTTIASGIIYALNTNKVYINKK